MLEQMIRPKASKTFADSSYQLFLLDRKAQRLSEHTVRFYKCHIPKFLEWCQTEHNLKSLDAVTSVHIRSYYIKLYEANLSSYSVHGTARALRAYFNFCVNENLLAESPMRKLKMPKLDHVILPAFEADDIGKLLKSCRTIRDRAIVLFLLDTGCRASEFIDLTGGNVDLAQGVVHIRKGKGGKDRVVYLGAKSRKALMRYYIERGEPGEKDPVWLCIGEKKRLTIAGLRQLLERLGERAEVAHCHPHTFRRTFALWSLRNGMTIYHLQRLMGHADISVLRQYLALVESDLKAAHNQYGAVDNMSL